MSHYITTHNSDGKAVFSDKIPTTPHVFDNGRITTQFVYTTHSAKPDLSTEADLEQYAHEREHGMGVSNLVTPNGFASALITFKPGDAGPLHRTMTADTVVVLSGDIELALDSGEVRTLHAGDTVVQRATSHFWRNITPNNGEVKLFAVTLPIAQPLVVNGHELGAEWPKR